jgi:hypothetical protein
VGIESRKRKGGKVKLKEKSKDKGNIIYKRYKELKAKVCIRCKYLLVAVQRKVSYPEGGDHNLNPCMYIKYVKKGPVLWRSWGQNLHCTWNS